jgi:hypothetical protein
MRMKNLMLGGILATIAILGPMVAYAGVSVIYPSSNHSVTTVATPPITFASGSDYALANTVGFASSFATADAAADFSITLAGLGGGTVIIDNYTAITKASSVTSYKLQVATAAAGTLDSSEISSLKVRLWTGGTAPVLDGSAGVCAVLDLESVVDTESAASCTGSLVKMQVVYALTSGAAGTTTVAIRPSSVVFA